MSQSKRAVLVPQYMKRFRCIGSACEDSCCVGWRVDIDHESYKKYRRVKNQELGELFQKDVTRNRSGSKSEDNFAKIKLAAGARCPFLNNEMLCRIQLEYDEEYLSKVCATYPRTVNLVDGVLERAATMSCPEIAKIALLGPETMEFDEDIEPIQIRNIFKHNIDTTEVKYRNKPEKYFWEFRIFSITLLQDRSLKIWERLVVLGFFYDQAQRLVENGKVNELSGLIASFTAMQKDGSFKTLINDIPVQNTIQMELLKEVADKRYFAGVSSKRYIECFNEFLYGIYYAAEDTVEEIGKRYREAWEKYYEPYMKDREYIFENYLVNYIFKNAFPFTGEKSLFDAYMVLVIHFALIKMHLIGMAGYHKGLTDELVVKLVQSFAKTVEHNHKYLIEVADLMRRNAFNTMAYMAILVKN